MNVHDEAFMDSIAVLALGALPEAEARELAAHVATCGPCRREYDELRSTANTIGYSAEASSADLDEVSAARMKSAVMRAVRASAGGVQGDREGASAVHASRRWATAWLPYGAAAAALVFAFLSSASNNALRSQHENDVNRLAALEARSQHQALQEAAERARVAALKVRTKKESSTVAAQSARAAAESARIAALEKTDARLADLFAPSSKSYAVRYGQIVKTGGHLYLALTHLVAPPTGKVYQAWTVRRGLKGVAPSITFRPHPSGFTLVELPENAQRIVAVAVTVEPAGGSKLPTSKPTFLRPLS